MNQKVITTLKFCHFISIFLTFITPTPYLYYNVPVLTNDI